MSYTLVVQPEAEEDAALIFDDLEEKEPGLGHRFLDALDDVYDHIDQVPFGFQKRYNDYRHGKLRRFPYRVVYLVEGQMIHVYQVRHTRRRKVRYADRDRTNFRYFRCGFLSLG